jgi:hypothetical protein
MLAYIFTFHKIQTNGFWASPKFTENQKTIGDIVNTKVYPA